MSNDRSKIKDKGKMKILLLLHLCCDLLAVKHSLKYFVCGSSGLPNVPEFIGVMVFDGIQTGYCDSSNKTLKPQLDWAKKILQTNPEQLEWYTQKCFEDQPNVFRGHIFRWKQRFNQSGGVHVIQRISGCEWDENTDSVNGVLKYGYNGEGFLEFDMKTLTWIALKPEADMIKLKWDADRSRIIKNKDFLTKICAEWLKMYVDNGKRSLHRTVLPSVSLLQKTPSSPVSCYAAGFYLDKAVMFWRKDGDEIHDGVEKGDILPNDDGTFQIIVDLNVSSVKPEDWWRYECVFQFLSGENIIVTKLNEIMIRTNWRENILRTGREDPSDMTVPIIPAVVVFVLIIIAAAGFAVYKKKKGERFRSNSANFREATYIM
uniref:major histocompatibility complex class I-related gene protein n=1 Tax=Maylandia zebra TaxID=106582 RepID=UPI000D31D51A|nr:major histocompatibility complex class I-related gene protein [Maylandia zebra]